MMETSLTIRKGKKSKIVSGKTKGLIRIGIVGCGYWGPNLIRNFYEIPEAEIAAICDSQAGRLKPLAKKFPLVKLTTHYQDLLTDSTLDAVVIATPVSTHYDLARRALKAGKHVMVEKPLSETAAQGVELDQLASRSRKILMVGHTFEYHPAVLKVAELLKAGELGRLYYIDSVRVNLGLYQSDGLNVIWDLAPHDISIILRWMNQVPRRVSAWAQAFVRKGVEDLAFIRLEFPDGVLAHIHISWLAPTKMRRITVVGDKKMIIYDDLENVEKIKVADRRASLDPSSPELRVGYRMGDIVSPRVDVTEPLSRECLHFIQSILKNQTPETSGQKGINVVRVLEAVDQSLKKSGAAVSL